MAGGTFIDDRLEDGFVQTFLDEYDDPQMAMNRRSYEALIYGRVALAEIFDRVTLLPPGQHLIPRSVLEREAAAEVRASLNMVEPEPSAVCIYMPCQQDAVAQVDGFHLCATHADLMRDWEDLVA